MSWLRSWGVSLRIARREARRNKGRSTLVLAMIGLPVLGLTFAAVSYDMFALTRAEKVERMLGNADARVAWVGAPLEQTLDGMVRTVAAESSDPGEPPSDAALAALLPAGSRAISIQQNTVQMRTATGLGNLTAFALTIADPMTNGMVTILDGVAPKSDTEVAVTKQAALRLGTTLGATVRTNTPDQSFTVTALVEMPEQLGEFVFFRSGAMPSAGGPAFNSEWLVASPTPLDWPAVRALNAKGLRVTSRSVLLDPPAEVIENEPAVQSSELAIGTIVIGLAIFEIVLLAGPAFAVGARRRQRELALVAAAGGTAAQVRRIVLADGAVLGAVGAVIGIVGGVALAFGGRTLIEEELAGTRAGGYRVFPLALVCIVVLAVTTGLLAALVPAFTAAKQNVIAALSGRRGIVKSRKRWIAVGLVMLAVGSVIAIAGALDAAPKLILAGLIIGQFSLALLTPSLVGLIGRLGSWLPLAPRIALRDTARNRSSAAPAISAVMAVVAGSVMIGIYMTSVNTRDAAYYGPFGPEGSAMVSLTTWGPNGEGRVSDATLQQLQDRLREILPVNELAVVDNLTCPRDEGSYCSISLVLPPQQLCPYGEQTPPAAELERAHNDARCLPQGTWGAGALGNAVDDGGKLALMTGAEADDLGRATSMLQSGGVVVSDPRYVTDGQVTLEHTGKTVEPGTPSRRMTLPAYAMTTGARGINLILPPSVLPKINAAIGGEPVAARGYLLASTTRMPTTAQEDRLNQAISDIDMSLYTAVERGPGGRFDPTLLILALASTLITLAAAGIATGLAAADGRADLATLAAVGASPRLRRTLSLSQSGVIAGLGTMLGVAAGVGGAFAIINALNVADRRVWPPSLEMPLVVPWGNLITVLAVPLVAMLGAGLLTRSRLPIERRSG